MKKTRVVHVREEEFDVYIGRPSIWGNPYSHHPGKGRFTVATREEAIEKFEKRIRGQPHMLKMLRDLRGKVLGCWCKPKACHGDVLVKLIEEKYGARRRA